MIILGVEEESWQHTNLGVLYGISPAIIPIKGDIQKNS